MAKIFGKDLTSVSMHTTEMKTDTTELGFKVSADVEDVTTLTAAWHAFLSGLKGGDTFDHTVLYDNTNTTGTWAKYTAELGATGTFSFTDGVRTVSVSTIVKSLSLPVKVGEMMKVTATHQMTGVCTFS